MKPKKYQVDLHQNSLLARETLTSLRLLCSLIRRRHPNNRQSPRGLTADSDQQPNHPNNRHRRRPNTAELPYHPYQARCHTSANHPSQNSYHQDSCCSHPHQQSNHHQHHRLCRCQHHRHHQQPKHASPTTPAYPTNSDPTQFPSQHDPHTSTSTPHTRKSYSPR